MTRSPTQMDLSVEDATRRSVWRTAAQSAGIGTYLYALPGQDVVADDLLLRLLGLDPAAFTGRGEQLWSRLHPDDVAEVGAHVQHAISTTGAYRAEFRVLDPAGTTRWVVAHGQVVHDRSGTATALVGAAYDVTAVREATARTSDLLETLAVGYLHLDAQWRFTYVNHEGRRITAPAGQELVGQVIWEVFPDTVGTVFEEHYRRAVTSEQTVTFDAHYPAPFDAWYEIRAIPQHDGLSLYFLDVTARHKAQEAAERSAQRLAAVGGVTLALAVADDLSDLVATMAEQGLDALGADGGSVAVPDPDDPTHLLSYTSANFGESARNDFGRVPLEAELPVTLAARTGQRVLLGDQQACTALSPLVVAANEATGCQAWASLPLHAEGEVIGVLTAGWKEPQVFDAEQLSLVETFASLCTQALQRLGARDAERSAARAAHRAAQQQGALVAIAMALDEAGDEAAVLSVVTGQGAALLDAQGGVLCLRVTSEETGTGQFLRALTTTFFDDRVQADVSQLPTTFPLPMVETAISGTAYYFPDRAGAIAAFPGAADLYAAARTEASAAVPLHAGGTLLGSLSLAFDHDRDWTRGEQELLEAFATLTAQALDRIAFQSSERAAIATARVSARQQAALVDVAQALGQADTEDDVLGVVADRGLSLFDGLVPALCLREVDGRAVRTLTREEVPAGIRTQLQHLPTDYPLPLVDCAVNGTAHFLDDLAQTVAVFPAAEAICIPLGVQAQASVPLHARGKLLGSLSLGFTHSRSWPRADQDLMNAFAALTAQALARIAAHDAEAVANAEVARFSETLQRSLLTSPPEPNHLHIAVRYAPAAERAQVGGDWYDAFITADGTTSLVIGDVTGHDRIAAAAMGQLRNLLRGIGYAVGDPPAAILTTLDQAAHDLGVDTTATAILARIEQTPQQRRRGERLLRWSNAGHLPPLLVEPDGKVRYLEAAPDLMLGVAPDLARHDHEVLLEPGSTLLLYTDGLIERRDSSLPAGMNWLAATVTDLAGLPVDDLCDELLARVGQRVEDDVALLAVRAHPEDEPRPVQAGARDDPREAPTVPTVSSTDPT